MRITGKILLPAVLLLGWAVAQNKTIVLSDTPNYDRSRQQVFTGFVGEVKEYLCPVSGTVGSHIAVRGVTETVEVHMAPAAFMKENGMVIKQGEKVEITGVKVTFNGKPAMLAKSVSVRNEVFYFRDDKGRPLW